MHSIRIALAALFIIGTAFGQDVAKDDRVRVPEAIQAALDLTDDQIEQLRANNAALREAVRPLAQDAAAKQRELRQEMRNETPNEAIIGTVTMELETARGVLTLAQVEALGPIEDAAALAQEVREAVVLNLVAPAKADGAGNKGRGRGRGPGGQRGGPPSAR